ncbi:hypothetical protein C8J57DRAFT_1498861 [Mycena rebaudengoi]|nr:hypothetical protein C8J57DRAFT_1498861 [Mycena rebaudengoi]
MATTSSSSEAAHAAAELQAAIIAGVKHIFGTAFIGFAVATTCVALLFLLDTLSTIFVAHSLYQFYVLNFGKNPLVNLLIPWSFSTEKLLVTLITFVAQCFYAHAIWNVSVSKFVTGFILFLAVIISGLVQGLAALNDVVITVSMCYYLQSSRSGLPSTNLFVDRLIIYAVSRGTLTAITQVLFLVTNVALPNLTYWQPFHQAVGKLYVNSVLATLNIRSTFKEKSEVQLGTANFKFTAEGRPTDGQISTESADSFCRYNDHLAG